MLLIHAAATLFMVGVIWFVQTDIQRRLVLSNWLRTAAWTARGIIAMAMVAPCLAS